MQRDWGGIAKISQCQNFYLAWALHYNPTCGVRFWEEIVFLRWLSPSRGYAISTEADISSAPSIEQSAMISGLDRSRARGRDFGGRERRFVGGECDSYGGKQSSSEKELWQCRYGSRNNHISEKCWEKFYRAEWTQLSESDSTAPLALLRTIYPLPPLFLNLSLLYWHIRNIIDFDS